MWVSQSKSQKQSHGHTFIRPVLVILIAIVLMFQYFLSITHDVQQKASIVSMDEFVGRPVSLKMPKEDSTTNASSALVMDNNQIQYHIVFSTSCSDQMLWESYVFFYHAMKVQQPGNVTRIASGCTAKEAEQLQLFHERYIQTMSNRFHLHLTPNFSKENQNHNYKYFNKPFGLRHWMENVVYRGTNTSKTADVDDGVVILMDPDMVLLRPLLHDFSKENVAWVEKNPQTTFVRHGFPIAQQDGYLDNIWMQINHTHITGDPNFKPPRQEDGPLHYNTGPPYLATVKDMYNIAVLWTEYAPRVLDVRVGTFSEMHAYILATVKLGLPHTLIKSIVVSNAKSPKREGWSYVDKISDEDICDPPKSTALPIGLHYCGRYGLGDNWFFSKYRLKKKFISCEQSLMMEPPGNISKVYDYMISPPRADQRGNQNPERTQYYNGRAKREAFMVCGMIRAVNEANTYFKRQNCGDKANFNQTYTIYNDPGKY